MLGNMMRFVSQKGMKLKLIIVFLFAGLEHLMDVVFVCPCDPQWNILASAFFFVLPATVIFLLMLVMQCSQTGLVASGSTSINNYGTSYGATLNPTPNTTLTTTPTAEYEPAVTTTITADQTPQVKEGRCEKMKKVLMALAVPVLWVMMMFFEGQFYVCARTDWSGRFVKLNDTYEHMWCKPDQLSLTADKMKLSIGYYVESQWAGLVLLSALLFYVLVYTIFQCRKRERTGTPQNT